jgi:hypothetical protein
VKKSISHLRRNHEKDPSPESSTQIPRYSLRTQNAYSIKHDDLLVVTAATLATRSFHDLDLVILVSFDGAGSGALGGCFLLDLESRGVAFLSMSAILRNNHGGAAYLEGSNNLTKLFGVEVVLRPLFEWKWSRLARNDVEGPERS